MNQVVVKDYIYLDLIERSFEDIVRKMSEKLVEDKKVKDVYPDKVIEREKTFPTALPTLPYGVAIPHTDSEFVNENCISVAVLSEPITMHLMGGSQADEVEVSILFLLALTSSNKQLNILKNIVTTFQNEELLERMMIGDKQEIFSILTEAFEE